MYSQHCHLYNRLQQGHHLSALLWNSFQFALCEHIRQPKPLFYATDVEAGFQLVSRKGIELQTSNAWFRILLQSVRLLKTVQVSKLRKWVNFVSYVLDFTETVSQASFHRRKMFDFIWLEIFVESNSLFVRFRTASPSTVRWIRSPLASVQTLACRSPSWLWYQNIRKTELFFRLRG